MKNDTSEGKSNRGGLFKRTGIKLACAVVLFFVFVILITAVISYPFDRIYSNSNQFNIVFLGASETEWGINPVVIDAVTGKKSCLLATSGCTFDGRYEMLKSAIQQESLELVVIDTAIFSLTKVMSNFDLDKRVLYYSRISGLFNRISTAFRKFSFWDDEFDQLYAETLYEGINAWQWIFDGEYEFRYILRGYDPQGCTSQLLTAEEALRTRDREHIKTKFRDENIERLTDIINLCREYEVPCMLVTIPLSEKYLWQYEGWDEFHDLITEYAKEQDVLYYDFNLLTTRQKYLQDDVSFRDIEHLCDAGVNMFSRVLGMTINAFYEEKKLPLEFYDSYEEAKMNGVYGKYQE